MAGRFNPAIQTSHLTYAFLRAILNIAAPYTSREEMSFAMRETATEYCQPLRPRLKRPFSESHITRNIQAHKIGFGNDIPMERFGDKKDVKGSQEDLLIDNEAIEYTPTTDIAKLAHKKFLAQIADVLKREDGQPLTEEELKGAANLALFSIKHAFVAEREDGEDFIEVMDVEIDGVPLMNLRHLAIGMTDYPKEQSFISSETTTVTAGDQTNVLPNPQRWRDAEQISENTLNSHMYTGSKTPPLDILVRTSGVERLSDFLLWQCHQKTDVVFVKCMWPQFGLSKFIPIILEWQWRQKKESYWREAESDWQKLE
jgi:putative undecaprenyl diphosphate synthase